MAPQELFRAKDVSITAHIARFGGVSYQIANIGSVRVLENKKPHLVMVALLVLAAAAFLFGYNGIQPAHSEKAYMVATILLFVAIAWQVVWPGREYVLVLKTSSGDVQAYKTSSRKHIFEVKDALEEAFSRRT